jgi:hypothetical protein
VVINDELASSIHRGIVYCCIIQRKREESSEESTGHKVNIIIEHGTIPSQLPILDSQKVMENMLDLVGKYFESMEGTFDNNGRKNGVYVCDMGIYSIYIKICLPYYSTVCVSVVDHPKKQCKQLVKELYNEFDMAAFKEYRTAYNRKIMMSVLEDKMKTFIRAAELKRESTDEKTWLLPSARVRYQPWYFHIFFFCSTDEK